MPLVSIHETSDTKANTHTDKGSLPTKAFSGATAKPITRLIPPAKNPTNKLSHTLGVLSRTADTKPENMGIAK